MTAYSWPGQMENFLDAVRTNLTDDPVFGAMVRNGVVDALDRAAEELDDFRP